jgi:hypothetical protein
MTSFKDVLPIDAGASNANNMTQFLRDKAQSTSRQTQTGTSSSQKGSMKSLFDPKLHNTSLSKPSVPMSTFQKTVLPQVDECSSTKREVSPPTDDFADFANFDYAPKNPNPVTVEVKPLPKIRLDLCPVPREEDEEEDSSMSVSETKLKKKSKPVKPSRHKHRKRTPRS